MGAGPISLQPPTPRPAAPSAPLPIGTTALKALKVLMVGTRLCLQLLVISGPSWRGRACSLFLSWPMPAWVWHDFRSVLLLFLCPRLY